MVLTADGAGRRFGAKTVFSGVDLVLHVGERLHLRGANGSGKTTLLRCVLGTMALSTGRLQVLGRPPGRGQAGLGACLNPELRLTHK